MTRDLFGQEIDDGPAAGEVALSLVLHDEAARAWLLGQTHDRRAARWVPKSEVKRGEGRDESVWTMPMWLARDRGWM